jgi:hypothetical protein
MSYTNKKGNLSFISSSRSKLLSVSTDEEKTTRDPNPPLVVKKGTSAKGEKNYTRRPHPKEKKNRSSNSSSRSKLLPESSDEEETTRDHNPPLTVKKALSDTGKLHPKETEKEKKNPLSMSSWRSEMLSVSTDEEETSRASTSTFVQKPPITVGKRHDSGRPYTKEMTDLSSISCSPNNNKRSRANGAGNSFIVVYIQNWFLLSKVFYLICMLYMKAITNRRLAHSIHRERMEAIMVILTDCRLQLE